MSGVDEAWPVSRLAKALKQRVESDWDATWVRGEVVGLKRYPSGHLYFGLRDQLAKVDCTIWRSVAAKLRSAPEEGTEVFALGKPAVWEERTALRFNIVQLIPTAEIGGTAQQVEQTRKRLAADGLLDPARKRKLPEWPNRIVVITSIAGAAVRDVISVARRRWPAIEILVIGATVQGEAAVAQLNAALATVALLDGVDLCIIGRGGGGKEDLAAFNDESVCRAIAACPVPVVSAVGHEVDVTLADLVADLRAATPSQAAEFALPDRDEAAHRLASIDAAMAKAMVGLIGRRRERDERTRDRLAAALTRQLHSSERRLMSAGAALPAALERHVRRPRERLADLQGRLGPAMSRRIDRLDSRIERLGATLHSLSPLAVLGRGYSMARSADGSIMRRVADFKPESRFTLRVMDGEIRARRLPE